MSLASWRATALGLAVALVVSVIGLVVVARGGDDGDRAAASRALALQQAESAAQKAARAAAVHLTSYDYRTLDKDFSWVEDGGTARFRAEYAEISTPIRELVTRLRARAEGSVVESAATATDLSHVTVLLFVDQTLTSPGQQRKLDQPRVTMSMVLDGGRWLVDDVGLRNLASQ